jgi:hypothetical protein
MVFFPLLIVHFEPQFDKNEGDDLGDRSIRLLWSRWLTTDKFCYHQLIASAFSSSR